MLEEFRIMRPTCHERLNVTGVVGVELLAHDRCGIIEQALVHEDPLKALLDLDLGLLVANGRVEALVLNHFHVRIEPYFGITPLDCLRFRESQQLST